jgi:hypothetical protein
MHGGVSKSRKRDPAHRPYMYNDYSKMSTVDLERDLYIQVGLVAQVFGLSTLKLGEIELGRFN